ncbi:MAG: hypothetical protein Ct9H90mP20_5380 [Candidatus Neomarinimicrobiota bacterium]|nr:MAG: hypothetical protein Ct9H90mP20_5380 [Candidatus Neomarinimicrobiota bacterium]
MLEVKKKYTASDITFEYRNSSFKSNEILIDAEFEFIQSNKSTVTENKIKASGGRKNKPTIKV